VEVHDVFERVLLTPGRFSAEKMSGSAHREATYDDDSTGDEYDQGRTIYNENFEHILDAKRHCCRPVGDAASVRAMACARRGLQ